MKKFKVHAEMITHIVIIVKADSEAEALKKAKAADVGDFIEYGPGTQKIERAAELEEDEQHAVCKDAAKRAAKTLAAFRGQAKEDYTCEECGAPFKASQETAKYCSQSCVHKAKRRRLK